MRRTTGLTTAGRKILGGGIAWRSPGGEAESNEAVRSVRYNVPTFPLRGVASRRGMRDARQHTWPAGHGARVVAGRIPIATVGKTEGRRGAPGRAARRRLSLAFRPARR